MFPSQVSLTTSLLLFLGLLFPLRPLLLPWLAAHALLCLCLVVASLNYLVGILKKMSIQISKLCKRYCQVLYTQVDCDNNACTILLGLSVSLTKSLDVIH